MLFILPQNLLLAFFSWPFYNFIHFSSFAKNICLCFLDDFFLSITYKYMSLSTFTRHLVAAQEHTVCCLGVFKLQPNFSILSLTHSLDWKPQSKRFLFIYFAEHYNIFRSDLSVFLYNIASYNILLHIL